MPQPTSIAPSVVGFPADPPIQVQWFPRHHHHGMHDHAFHEVVAITGGTAIHRSADGERRIGRGDVLMMAPGQVHGFLSPRRLSLWNLYYLAPWSLMHLRRLGDEPGLMPLCFATELDPDRASAPALQLRLEEPVFGRLVGELEALRDERARPSPSPLWIEACFLKVLTLLTRAAVAQRVVPPARSRHPAAQAARTRLAEAVTLGCLPTLGAIARRSGLSADHLTRVFRADTGLTPRAWFQRQRVHRACQLLLEDAAPVTVLAQRLGFADGPHFARTFRRVAGLSPSAYRQRFRQEPAGG